jgi:glutamate synthase domain-containing protein 2
MNQRYGLFWGVTAVFLGLLVFLWDSSSKGVVALQIVFGAVFLLGVYDLFQSRHSILRNYPLLGHFRFFAEKISPEIHQYFIENDTSGTPFSKNQRSLIYERAKSIEGLMPFGTELNVYSPKYFYMKHSLTAHRNQNTDYRLIVGGENCLKPYDCSVLNISAMSYGALGGRAIEAMNLGAKSGHFYHCTGEGGVSPYHLKHGGDLVWQIGTGYFGCRNKNGNFDPAIFQKTAAHPSVKMIEIKLSQGAKPGHGGVLPAAKVSREIAEARGVAEHEDCISPPSHSAFSTPLELCAFIKTLRDLSGGKPIGFKLCIGFESEFFSICKAMKETDILPDFITVDGGEGGTGAAPQELSDHVGWPSDLGLHFVHQTLIGCGLRDRIKIAAAGKIFSSMAMIRLFLLGADWCNAARAFMMSVGCIQARLCHTNKCPVGVATMDKSRQRALVVQDKAPRAYQFHKNTLSALGELLGACGVDHPGEISWKFFSKNDPLYLKVKDSFIAPEAFLKKRGPEELQRLWDLSQAESFVTA